jgi:hypothetical protein
LLSHAQPGGEAHRFAVAFEEGDVPREGLVHGVGSVEQLVVGGHVQREVQQAVAHLGRRPIPLVSLRKLKLALA